MTTRTFATAIAGLAAALLLTGCQSGPTSILVGNYRLLADATTSSPNTAAELAVTDTTVALTADGSTTSADLGAATSSYTLCAPSGKGTATELSAPLSINGTDFSHPAIYGDCGQTKPVRVTIIDLDSYNNDATKLPFARWAEFCNTTDPDC